MPSLDERISGQEPGIWEAIQPYLSGIGTGLQFVGDVFDTPWAMGRAAIAGENPLDSINPFDTSKRVSGREMLEKRGWADPNTEGLDLGDIAGFGVELLDPTNLVGGGLLARLLGKASKAKAANRGIDAANALSNEQRAMGFMPEEIANMTKIVNESGQPLKVHHGTTSDVSFRDLEPGFQTSFSKGIYSTPQKEMANFHSNWHGHLQPDWLSKEPLIEDVLKSASPPEGSRVLSGFVDMRNPLDVTIPALKDREAAFLRRVPESIREDVTSAVPQDAWRGRDSIVQRRRDSQQLKATELLQSLGHDGVLVRGPNGLEEVVAYDKSQHYLPYIAKELQDLQRIPNVRRALQALLAGNVAARGSSLSHQL